MRPVCRLSRHGSQATRFISTFGPLRQAWSLLREGLRGSTRDFTDGHVGHAVIVLAIPDGAWRCAWSRSSRSSTCSSCRSSAPTRWRRSGLTESLLAIVYSVAMGLCIGATAMVARRIGEKDADGAAVAAVQVIAVGLVVSAAHGHLRRASTRGVCWR